MKRKSEKRVREEKEEEEEKRMSKRFGSLIVPTLTLTLTLLSDTMQAVLVNCFTMVSISNVYNK